MAFGLNSTLAMENSVNKNRIFSKWALSQTEMLIKLLLRCTWTPLKPDFPANA